MGYHLKPVRPNKKFPKRRVALHYNLYTWQLLQLSLDSWGAEIDLPVYNDGEKIPARTCKEIAKLIFKHQAILKGSPYAWLLIDAPLWENCGGFEVY